MTLRTATAAVLSAAALVGSLAACSGDEPPTADLTPVTEPSGDATPLPDPGGADTPGEAPTP